MSDIEPDLTQAEWIAEQKKLIEAQTENITALVGAVETLAVGLSKRPTLGRVIVIVAVMSILSNIATVGFMSWVRDDIKKGQETSLQTITDNQAESAERGKAILALTEKVDDCLDTTVDDGDPIGKCAAEQQARLTFAISQVTSNVTCAVEAKFIEFLTLNPELEIGVPAPRPECDADGDN